MNEGPNNNFMNNNGQNGFGSFNSDKKDKEAIASRINESKARNRINSADQSAPSNEKNDSTSLDKKDELPKENIESKEKPSLKEGLKNNMKNVLVNKASNSENTLARIAGKTAKTIKNAKETIKTSKKVLTALKVFFSTPVGWVVLGLLALVLVALLTVVVISTVFGSLEVFYSESPDTTYETFNERYELGDTSQTINDIVETTPASEKLCGNMGFWQKLKVNIFGFDLKDPVEACFYNYERVQKYNKDLIVLNFFEVPKSEEGFDSYAQAWSLYNEFTSSVANPIDDIANEIKDLSEEKLRKLEVYLESGGKYETGAASYSKTASSYVGKMVRNPLTISHSDIDALKGELEKIDKGEFTASVYPGLIYSTFQYEYESQLLDEDGNPTIVLETNDETNAELSSLNTLIAAGKANKDDIESLFKNTLKNGLYYYSYIVPSSEEKIEPYCKRVWMDGNYSEQREKIFLRYGENAAKKYEIKDNQNTAVEFTSPECLYLLNPNYKTNIEGLFSSVDTVIENSNRLLTSAKNSGSSIVTVNDNSGEYNYKTGYIYTKFPRYEGKPEVDYLTAREIEIMIEDIVDRADIVDKVLGYKMDDIVGGTIMASGEWDTWKQFDSAWKDLQMDDYGDTMHHYGCFLTTIAMSIAKSAKHIVINSFNPGNLLIAARNANLLNESGAVKSVSGVIKVATGNTNHTVESAPLSGSMTDKANQIARYINEGYDVILRVKSNESERILASQKIYNAGNEHYVLVTGVENGIIHIADPGYNIESIPSNAAKNYINEGLVRVTLIKYF